MLTKTNRCKLNNRQLVANLLDRLLCFFEFLGNCFVHINTPFRSGNEKSPLWIGRSKEGYVRLFDYEPALPNTGFFAE